MKLSSKIRGTMLHITKCSHQRIGAISVYETELTLHALQEGVHNYEVHFSVFSRS